MTQSDLVLRHAAVRAALEDLDAMDAVARLQRRDPSLWSPDPQVHERIRERLGWLDVAGGSPGWPEELQQLRRALEDDGLIRIVLAGMGGSSLAPELFGELFPGLPLSVLDSTHPAAVRAAIDDTDLRATLVIISSKSGTTEETCAFAAHAATRLPGADRLAAITDPGSELEAEARDAGWRFVLANPADIGGRYSALSLFGMGPAALRGIDTAGVWERGQQMLQRCLTSTQPTQSPAALLAAFMGGLARTGRDKLTILASPALAPLADWVEQLVAESTGKDGQGIVPIVGEPAGAPDVYGDDRAFVLIRLAGGEPGEHSSLSAAGHPVLEIELDDPLDVGAEFMRWEAATALAGALLGVNPFDEPNVTESKRNTMAILADVAAGSALPPPESGPDGALAALIGGLRRDDYFALHAYLAPDEITAAALQRLRTAVRDRTGCATTLGWGPRFLHSTGQLHKGGPDSLVALQLVDAGLWEAGAGDPVVAGRGYDFGTLIRAQAVGDLRSLRAHGRRVVQVGVTSAQDIDRLTRAIA